MEQTKSYKSEKVTAIIVFSLAVLFYLYEFAIRTMPSVMIHDLMRDFGITAAGLGVLSSLFYYGYTVMQIPVGLLFDKFSARKLIVTAMLATTLATVLFGFATNIYQADLAYFIIGFAASFGFIGALVLTSRWFPPKNYTFLVGIVQFMGSIGAIVGQHPIAFIVSHVGWRHTTLLAAATGVVITILMWFYLKDHKPNPALTDPHLIEHNVMKGLKQVLHKKQTWWVALYSFCSWTPVVIFTGLWGIPFLMKLYNTSVTVAASAMTASWLGIAIASPLLGLWTDRLGLRRPLLIVCAILGIITSILVIYVPNLSWPLMYFFLFVLGCAAAGQSLSFGTVQDINPPKVAGTAIAFNNMAIIAGGIFLPPLVGLILKMSWTGEMLNNVHIYSITSYRVALIFVPICYVVGLLVSIFCIKETHCKPNY